MTENCGYYLEVCASFLLAVLFICVVTTVVFPVTLPSAGDASTIAASKLTLLTRYVLAVVLIWKRNDK